MSPARLKRDSLKPCTDFKQHDKENEETVKNMLDLAKAYNKAVQEEDEKSAEKFKIDLVSASCLQSMTCLDRVDLEMRTSNWASCLILPARRLGGWMPRSIWRRTSRGSCRITSSSALAQCSTPSRSRVEMLH